VSDIIIKNEWNSTSIYHTPSRRARRQHCLPIMSLKEGVR